MFGRRINPVLNREQTHNGIDIGMEEGSPVVAVSQGTVTETGESETYGLYIKYAEKEGYSFMYAHLSDIKVKKDQEIQQGEVIGLSGNTGMSTGPHLHFSAFMGEEAIDPRAFVSLPLSEEMEEKIGMGGD